MSIKLHEISRPLTMENIDEVLNNIIQRISGRVEKAFLFGSAARRDFDPDSDIDIILVKETNLKFVRRAFEFEDLFDLYPRLDIIVYTPVEFSRQIKKDSPFWENFHHESVQLI